jgi:2-keto-3-deoxy-L-fuconate dehydrogenase
VADVDEDGGRRVSKDIGDAATFQRVDVTDPGNVRQTLEAAADHLGSLDILVNNAGIGFVGGVEETPEDDFERLHRVNVNGVFHGCKYALPIMLRKGRGNIINIGSVAGLVGIERRFAYSSTKGAVIAMTRQVAIDYATRGIRCNCICPGTIYSPFVDSYLEKFHAGEVEETKAKLHARQPVGRMGEPVEVARMALYLAADESEFVTGSILTIDGGLTAR